MKNKNKVFDKMISGGFKTKQMDLKEHVNRFTDITVMQKMGWTYSELMDTPQDVFDDIVLIMNKQSARQQQQDAKNKGVQFTS